MVTISAPTSMFGKAFLATAWKDRGKLTERERNGFAQFFYMTVCGHLEHTLSQHILSRVSSIRLHFDWRKPPQIPCAIEGKSMLLDGKPLAGSILAILSSLDAEIHSAPLSKLIELHNRIFSTKLLHRIGADLNHDLLALADLRNLFAHGRIWRLDIPGDPSGSGTLDGNPVKGAALRLHAANIISDLAFNGRTHGDFTQRFYSDEALLYFYDKAKLIEAALFSTMDFEAEKFWLKSETPLPDLEPIPSADPTAVT